jgi:hypothetical protein
MHKGLELPTLATKLTELVEQSDDFIADTRRMGFYVGPDRVELTIDGADSDAYAVNDHAQNQMAQRLKVPFPFWERMRNDHPDILQDTVGKLLVREPEIRMVRTVGDTARAYLSNRYRRLDNYDLMEQSVAPALAKYGDTARVLSCGLTDLRMYVKVLFPDVSFDDPRGGGSKVFGGLYVGNSDVGAGKLTIEPFTYADFCTNGMIFGKTTYANFGLAKTHLGRIVEEGTLGITDDTRKKEDEVFFQAAREVIEAAASGIHFAAIAEQVQRAAGIKVGGDPVAVVQRLAKTTDITEAERGGIMRHLIEGGDLSAWGYANAVTRTAEDVESYDRSTELERLGGDIVEWSERAWQALEAEAMRDAVAA